MNPLIPLLSSIVVAPLLVFYVWMFRDMTNNPALSESERYNWTLAFIVLNVFAAALYFNQYRNG